MRTSTLVFFTLCVGVAFAASGCRITVVDDCGDGIRDFGEGCDDGNRRNGDGCSSTCQIETVCGDGILDTGEGCDDGNLISGDGCSAACMVETTCGDGFLDVGEGCDDGNNISGDGCSANCMVEGFCGDGFQDVGEECDDGGNVDGDGCSATCTLESTGYLICDVPGDCSGRDICYDVIIPTAGTDGAMCTHTCGNDGECMGVGSFTGRCYSVEGAAAVCFQACDIDSDCFVGNVCIEVDLTPTLVDFICVPDNTP